MKGGEWRRHHDIAFGYYCPSDDTSEGESSAPPEQLTTGNSESKGKGANVHGVHISKAGQHKTPVLLESWAKDPSWAPSLEKFTLPGSLQVGRHSANPFL